MPSSIIVMCGEVKQCSVRCSEWTRVRSTASICAQIVKIFCCKTENTWLPYAEEYVRAGSDASISG